MKCGTKLQSKRKPKKRRREKKKSELLDPTVTLFKNNSDQDEKHCYSLKHVFKILIEDLEVS